MGEWLAGILVKAGLDWLLGFLKEMFASFQLQSQAEAHGRADVEAAQASAGAAVERDLADELAKPVIGADEARRRLQEGTA